MECHNYDDMTGHMSEVTEVNFSVLLNFGCCSRHVNFYLLFLHYLESVAFSECLAYSQL
jgi:hypothetical protein